MQERAARPYFLCKIVIQYVGTSGSSNWNSPLDCKACQDICCPLTDTMNNSRYFLRRKGRLGYCSYVVGVNLVMSTKSACGLEGKAMAESHALPWSSVTEEGLLISSSCQGGSRAKGWQAQVKNIGFYLKQIKRNFHGGIQINLFYTNF